MIDFTFTNAFSPKNCRSWYFAKRGSGLQFTLSGELFFWDRQRQNNLNQQPKELSFQQAWDVSGGLYLLLGQSPWNVSECLAAVADLGFVAVPGKAAADGPVRAADLVRGIRIEVGNPEPTVRWEQLAGDREGAARTLAADNWQEQDISAFRGWTEQGVLYRFD